LDATHRQSRHSFRDPKKIHRLLFGVYYQEDIFEKFCEWVPLAMRAFAWRVPAPMRTRKLIFLHVPRAQGTSIAHALYGVHCIQHHSARYFKTVAPRLWRKADSFSVLRDPYDRFASAYAFVRSGGTVNCRLSSVFLEQTASIRTVDDYLSFVEERDVFSLDFVMRPQSWFVCDSRTGLPLVKRLFLYGRDRRALAAYLGAHGVTHLPWLNRSFHMPIELSARQKARVEKLYAADFELVEKLSNAPTATERELLRAMGVAAE
jgi:hypothetical protein